MCIFDDGLGFVVVSIIINLLFFCEVVICKFCFGLFFFSVCSFVLLGELRVVVLLEFGIVSVGVSEFEFCFGLFVNLVRG